MLAGIEDELKAKDPKKLTELESRLEEIERRSRVFIALILPCHKEAESQRAVFRETQESMSITILAMPL
jgi:hypothetical protein